MPPVTIAQARIFTVELERPLDAARGQHRERFVLNTREGAADSHAFDPGALAVDLLEQRFPVADLFGGQADGERQLIDPKARIIGVGLDVPGIELHTKNAGVLAAKAVSVVQVGG